MDALAHLTEYYQTHDEQGRLASRHGQVEYLTTMRYLEKYLVPGMQVLEVGAGTGRYSHALAQMGYAVDAVELIEHNIDLFNATTMPGETVRIRQGNATDLSCFADETFDCTLVLGPMYHLFTEADQRQVLAEALRVTKRNGLLFVAYCISDPSIISYGFQAGHIFELIEKGLLDTDGFKALSTPAELFQLYRKEDIDDLLIGLPVTRLHYLGTDLFTRYIREAVDAMDEETFALYLKYHLAICERPDQVGMTNHSLDILKKL